MDIVTINAILLPWFAIVFIPSAIRDKQTGNYLGYKNTNVLVLALTLISIQSILVLAEFGFSELSVARILFNTALPFVLALVWLALTQRKLYGNKFSMKIRK